MIAVDTNILVHAHRRDSPWHEAAVTAIRSVAESGAAWAIPWPCVHEFLAIVTHPRIYSPPSTLPQAVRQFDAWRESPVLMLLSEDESYWEDLARMLKAGRIAGAQVHDARIAALCRRYGVSTLWSADRDFSRFPDLVVQNPLVA